MLLYIAPQSCNDRPWSHTLDAWQKDNEHSSMAAVLFANNPNSISQLRHQIHYHCACWVHSWYCFLSNIETTSLWVALMKLSTAVNGDLQSASKVCSWPNLHVYIEPKRVQCIKHMAILGAVVRHDWWKSSRFARLTRNVQCLYVQNFATLTACWCLQPPVMHALTLRSSNFDGHRQQTDMANGHYQCVGVTMHFSSSATL